MLEEKRLDILHLCERYRVNVQDLVRELHNIFLLIKDIPDIKSKLATCFEEIIEITGKAEDHRDRPNSFADRTKSASFMTMLTPEIDVRVCAIMDFLSINIRDFAFTSTGDILATPDDKKFGDYPYRTPELFFKQKGQLWVLNCLFNILDLAPNNPDHEKLIRSIVDADFCPYPKINNKFISDDMIIELITQRFAETMPKSSLSTPPTIVPAEKRTMGFELECQMQHYEADLLLAQGKYGEEQMLDIIAQKLIATGDKGLTRIQSATTKSVAETGSITRDASNARCDGYIAFEYASPAMKIKHLTKTMQSLCKMLQAKGGLVRSDCGTHLHISIEDLKPTLGENENIRIAKLEALKRILKTYAYYEEVFESIIPWYRRADFSIHSGQPEKTFVGGNLDFILNLIDSCKTHEELRDAIMVSGKSLSLAIRENTIEFRNFPATLDDRVLANYFMLINKFVDNCIRNVPPEKCIDMDILEQIRVQTIGGTYVEGRHREVQQDIFYSCNTLNYERFICSLEYLDKIGTAEADTFGDVERISPQSHITAPLPPRERLLMNLIVGLSFYIGQVTDSSCLSDGEIVLELEDCPVGKLGISRKPGVTRQTIIQPTIDLPLGRFTEMHPLGAASATTQLDMAAIFE